MATIKVKFRPSTIADHEGTIYYQIIHERKVRQLLTHYHVFPVEWSEDRSMVKAAANDDRKFFILSIRERIRRDLERLNKIIRRLQDSGLPCSSDCIIEEFTRYADEYSFFNYMEGVIARLRHNNKIRTTETYKATLASFRKFRHDEDLMLECLTSDVMESYEAWLRNRGLTSNTVSFYSRILRAVYNRAVEDGIIENTNPFRRVYTGVDRTVKRALPLSVIRKIKGLDLSLSHGLDYARDMFMLSFYLRGMSFIDMAYLKKTDLKDGYISYRRRKTGQRLTIEWTKEMRLILDKYPENESEYLLPIIRSKGINERCAYRNATSSINVWLKKIAAMVNVTVPLSMYVARHSWASAAKTKGVPLSVISEGMGHDSESTTRIYLASLDASVVDRANAMIMESL